MSLKETQNKQENAIQRNRSVTDEAVGGHNEGGSRSPDLQERVQVFQPREFRNKSIVGSAELPAGSGQRLERCRLPIIRSALVQ